MVKNNSLGVKKVLIAFASKHGSTKEIAQKIAKELETQNLEVDLVGAGKNITISKYDAVIIGSAIYAGNWLKEAKKFIDEYSNELKNLPVWLFSDGPVGNPLLPNDSKAVQASLINEIVSKTNAKEHHLFAGKIEPSDLSFGEKIITKAFRVKTGDFRDWAEISTWAAKVGKEIKRLT